MTTPKKSFFFLLYLSFTFLLPDSLAFCGFTENITDFLSKGDFLGIILKIYGRDFCLPRKVVKIKIIFTITVNFILSIISFKAVWYFTIKNSSLEYLEILNMRKNLCRFIQWEATDLKFFPGDYIVKNFPSLSFLFLGGYKPNFALWGLAIVWSLWNGWRTSCFCILFIYAKFLFCFR